MDGAERGGVAEEVVSARQDSAGTMRAGHGFAGLRKRYVRRAEFLTQDPEFRAYVRRFRDYWNCEYPRYSLPPKEDEPAGIIPSRLWDAWHDHQQRLESLLAVDEDRVLDRLQAETGDQRHTVDEWDRQVERLRVEAVRQQFKRRMTLLNEEIASAFPEWVRKIEKTVLRFFPWEDFPNPFPQRFGDWASPELSGPLAPPAHLFAGVALQTDPRLIEDVDSLIMPMSLEPIGLDPYWPPDDGYIDPSEGESVDDDFPPEPDVVSDADMQWYLPLYPGITVKDLTEAAPEIVREVNEIYASRTPTARVHNLREEGLTHAAIANRLGLTEPTVASILRLTQNP